MKNNRIYALSPKAAWDEYVSYSVEIFVSLSYEDGFRDLADACKNYVEDIPKTYERPFLQSQLEQIANLLERHIAGYLKSIGGISNLRIYTNEELEEIWQEEVDALILLLDPFIIRPEPEDIK